MLQDAKNMFATDLAHDGTPEVIDLKHAKAGPGRRLMVAINGSALAGATGVKLVHGATSSPATDLAEITISSARLNKGITMSVPETVLQYLTIALVGVTSAGTYNAGIVFGEGQTNL